MEKKVGIAAACMRVRYDKTQNLDRIVDLIERAADLNIRLLVFPEVILQGYCWDLDSASDTEQKRYYYEQSEPVPGPCTDHLLKYTKRHRMFVQIGLAERAATGGGMVLYNSVCLLGPKGIVGVFRKVHNKFEHSYFNSGNSIPVWQTELGRIAPMICYDLCFPEMLRIQTLEGAEIVSMSTAWSKGPPKYKNHIWGTSYDVISRANAFMNQVWIIESNYFGRPIGRKSEDDYYGHSRIISPLGETVSEIVSREGLATCNVSIKKGIIQARLTDFYGLNMIKDRRPELYSKLSESQ